MTYRLFVRLSSSRHIEVDATEDLSFWLTFAAQLLFFGWAIYAVIYAGGYSYAISLVQADGFYLFEFDPISQNRFQADYAYAEVGVPVVRAMAGPFYPHEYTSENLAFFQDALRFVSRNDALVSANYAEGFLQLELG